MEMRRFTVGINKQSEDRRAKLSLREKLEEIDSKVIDV